MYVSQNIREIFTGPIVTVSSSADAAPAPLPLLTLTAAAAPAALPATTNALCYTIRRLSRHRPLLFLVSPFPRAVMPHVSFPRTDDGSTASLASLPAALPSAATPQAPTLLPAATPSALLPPEALLAATAKDGRSLVFVSRQGPPTPR